MENSGRDVNPLDLLNLKSPRSDAELKEHRMELCIACEHFRERSQRCMKCGCFMQLKSTLLMAKCPIGKW